MICFTMLMLCSIAARTSALSFGASSSAFATPLHRCPAAGADSAAGHFRAHARRQRLLMRIALMRIRGLHVRLHGRACMCGAACTGASCGQSLHVRLRSCRLCPPNSRRTTLPADIPVCKVVCRNSRSSVRARTPSQPARVLLP